MRSEVFFVVCIIIAVVPLLRNIIQDTRHAINTSTEIPPLFRQEIHKLPFITRPLSEHQQQCRNYLPHFLSFEQSMYPAPRIRRIEDAQLIEKYDAILEDDRVYFGIHIHPRQFVAGGRNLLELFKPFGPGVLQHATYFINQVRSQATIKSPEVLREIINSGAEIALYTYFNAQSMGGGPYQCSFNRTLFEESGIVIPKQQLENFVTNYTGKPFAIRSFKGGNHCRTLPSYQALRDHGIEVDATMVYNRKDTREVHGTAATMFNDAQLSLGASPWLMDTDIHPKAAVSDPCTSNNTILVVPEFAKKDVHLGLEHILRIRDRKSREPIYISFPIRVENDAGAKDIAIIKLLQMLPRVKFASLSEFNDIYRSYMRTHLCP